MKINCIHCNRDMRKLIKAQFAQYAVGKFTCPYCHRQNKRYISEFDVQLNTFANMVIYAIGLTFMCITTMLFYNASDTMMQMLAIIAITMVFVLYGISFSAEFIYLRAPFKEKWATITMKDDAVKVAKDSRRYFAAFLLLIFVLGLIVFFVNMIYYIIGMIAFLILFCFKLRKTYLKEKTYYESTFKK